MIPIHFGSSERMLFGLYSPAAQPRQRRGALLLNPFGSEAFRSHRSIRQLADKLAVAGVDVFRFDYFGTGDSFGEGDEISLKGWLDDAETAMDELIGAAGVQKVTVVGLRLGGLLAGFLAARRPREVDRVIFWDPIWRGADFLAELGVDGGEEAQNVSGFLLPYGFRQELERADLGGLPGTRARVLVATAREEAAPGAAELKASKMSTEVFASPLCWEEEKDFGAGAVPLELVKRMASWKG